VEKRKDLDTKTQPSDYSAIFADLRHEDIVGVSIDGTVTEGGPNIYAKGNFNGYLEEAQALSILLKSGREVVVFVPHIISMTIDYAEDETIDRNAQ
jgi:hypothetical protein